MNTEEKYHLITRHLVEVIGEDELKEKLEKQKDFRIYLGVSITGSMSVAYFFQQLIISDFLKAGCKVTLLLADLHGLLDRTPFEILDKRYEYYEEGITTIQKTLGVDTTNLEFVRGSSYQLSPEYMQDLLKLSTFASVHDATKAGSEVVKQGDNPKLSGLIYPLMQALDEEYLKVDAQLGGTDQRKIMVFARENMPKIGYERRIELMNPLIRGFIGEKMSSSSRAGKMDFMDDEDTVNKIVKKADCVAKDPDNGIMAMLKHIFFTIHEDAGTAFVIERDEKYGGNLEYETYAELEKDFVSGALHPMDLKNGFAKEMNTFLTDFRKNKKLSKIHMDAYPEFYE